MRTLSEILLTIVAVFVALHVRGPWPFVLIGLYYGAFLFKFSALAKRFNLPDRLRDVLFGFLFLWTACGGVIYDELSALIGSQPNQAAIWWPITILLGTETARGYWALWLGIVPAVAVIVSALGFYGYFAARAMFSIHEQYKDQESRAILSAIGLFLGIDNGIWIVKNNAVQVMQNPKFRFSALGGPGVLLIHTGHLVILEQSGMVTRLVGRGITLLAPFEGISMVVPLYGRAERITVEKAVSMDRVIIEQFELTVFHKIYAGAGPSARDGQYTYHRDTVLNTIWSPNGNDWREAVKSVAELQARDVIGQRNLDQLVPMSASERSAFKADLVKKINQVTEKVMGVHVSTVEIGKIKIPAEAEGRLLDKWIAEWEQKIDTTRAATEADVQTTLAGARKRAIETVGIGLHVRPQDLIIMRFIEYLEARSENHPATDGDTETLVQLQSMEALQALRKAIGS